MITNRDHSHEQVWLRKCMILIWYNVGRFAYKGVGAYLCSVVVVELDLVVFTIYCSNIVSYEGHGKIGQLVRHCECRCGELYIVESA